MSSSTTSSHKKPDPARVFALFDALADLEPELAQQKLEAECGSDLELRLAVTKLLNHDQAVSQRFLVPKAALFAQVLLSPQDQGLEAPNEAAPELQMGSSRLGRFYVLHKLGEGGMGLVYTGYDESLDRRVALKVLRGGISAHGWLLREAQALGRLAHPNIVSVYEVGEHQGHIFLAMELIKGPTLKEWLSSEPRSLDAILRIFVQAGRGLEAAHEAGLVHRDFKPENVLIGEDGRARVADFGIAGLEGGAEAEQSSLNAPARSALLSELTSKGGLMGTPTYMAPEQFSGERATAASDQWAFCVALYRAAYGIAPFSSEDFGEFVRSVQNEAPKAAPKLGNVPGWLEAILLKGLQKNPKARFESMKELNAAIERHLPRDPELDPAPIMRQRAILNIALVFIGLVGGGFMLTDEGARRLTQPESLVGMGLFMLGLNLVVLAILWKKLKKNKYGRRISGLFLMGATSLFAHRLAAVRLGMEAGPILVGDLLIIALFFGMLALLDEAWMGWPSLVAALGAICGVLWPGHAPTFFGMAGLFIALTMGVRAYMDRRAGGEMMGPGSNK